MPLFGTRLDRPTAVGDEGRPRATSLTIASLVVFALLAVAGHTAGVFSVALSLATLAGLVAAGMALLNRERFVALFLGQLCYVLGGTGLVGVLGSVLVLAPAYGLLLSGFALALVGLTTSWADVADRDSTKAALFQGGVSYVTMLLWFVVGSIVGAIAFLGWSLLTGGTSVPPTPSVLAFLFTVSLSALFVWLGVRWLPLSQLTPRDRRPRVERRLRRVRLAIAVLSVTALLATVVGVVAWALGAFDALYATIPLTSRLFTTLSSPFVLAPVLLGGVAVLATALAALALRRVTRPVDVRSNRILAGVVAGFAFTVLALPFLFSTVPLPGFVAILVAIALVVLGPVTLLAVGTTLVVAVALDVLPDRAGGPAVAAGGLVLATIGAGLVGVPSPVVFACAAGGMVVWDVSSFGLGVTAELGHLPETRRLELSHGVLAVGLAVVVVALLTGLDAVRTTVASGLVAGPAILLAVAGVLLLLSPVRG